ncbi:MAG: ABC transporter ATP-binding protein [Clostridiales bacterium]|nr:ABC transporter ATP-binding protein [Clostridiales bacterium]
MENILEVKDLCKTYIVNSISNNVLCNVNFKMKPGEFVSVMGPSGSGKSTLLYTVSGMDNVTAGEVTFCGKKLTSMKKKEMMQLRLHKMGFIFQQMYMMKKLCIFDNIVLPGYQSGEERKTINARAEQLMRRLGIIEIAENEINEVSGGQLQRACLCRALINQPQIIFADEPTGALNSKAASGVMDELLKANQEGTSVLMVTHSVKVAARSERVIYLMDGGIQGELQLGKMETESDMKDREKKLNAWLLERGW